VNHIIFAFTSFSLFSKFISFVFSIKLCFLFLTKDLKDTLAQELDFENEGRNGERCGRELKSLSYVHIPAIHWDKTSKVRNSSLHLLFLYAVIL